MTLTIESTDQTLMLGDQPARVWRGRTDSGMPLRLVVTHVRVVSEAETIEMQPEPGRDGAFAPA